jgi:hypothetical protein
MYIYNDVKIHFTFYFPNLEILVKQEMEKIVEIQELYKQQKKYQKIEITNFKEKKFLLIT